MRWERAVHHVDGLAQECARMSALSEDMFPLRVTQLWLTGDILGAPQELDWVTAALCVDLPPHELAWWSEPAGAQHWANATRMNKNPVLLWWRSAHAPVWNHRIVRPALVWDIEGGTHTDVLAAIRDGDTEAVRSPEPAGDVFAERMRSELAISLDNLRRCSAAYDDRRWRPGKLTPVSDALWRATDGYLDVLSSDAAAK